VAFSDDGSMLASAGQDRSVRLWNPETGESLKTLDGHTDWVLTAAFSRSVNLLATCSGSFETGEIKIWEPEAGQVHAIKQPDPVSSVQFSADGKLLASCTLYPDAMVRVWDVKDWSMRHEFEGHVFDSDTHGIRGVSFSHDSKRVLSAAEDRTVRVWKLD
jgi:WD40 repeat protein